MKTYFLLICCTLLLITCKKTDTGSGGSTLSNVAQLLSISVTKQYNPTLPQDFAGTIDETTKQVIFTLPPLTSTSNLIVSFTTSPGVTVKVGALTQVNSQTPNNFTSPQTYVLTAPDGTQVSYTVTMIVTPNDQALITSFSFAKVNNSILFKDMTGHITKDDKEVVLHNPYFTKTSFIPSFTLSAGAIMKVNGVAQTSGVSSINFSPNATVEVIAQSGKINTYTIKTTPHIVNFEEFVKECPTNDPNINQILNDFQFRMDGNIVTSFPCAGNTYYPMNEAQFNDQVKWLQTLRILFYLDYGQTNHLPWTNLRIYDWLKLKIGGINMETGLNGGYCCVTYNNKPFINVGMLKNNPFGNYAQIPDIYSAWTMNNFVLLLHETRHLDGYAHSSCCVAGANRCDSKYDLTDLSPYGMHMWWYESVLTRKFNFGFDCMPSSFINPVIDGTWTTMNNQKSNFCIQPTIIPKPAYWNDCKFK